MTHGAGFLASYSSSRTVVAGLHPRLVAFFVRYLELRLQLLGLEVSRDWFSFTDSCSPVRECPVCFGGFLIMSVVFLLYLMMLILHWEWGWSALALATVLLLISIGISVSLDSGS